MKVNRSEIIWGVVLVLAGLFFLGQNMGIVPDLSPILWTLVFGAVSAGFFVTYFTRGKAEWWWLFPAFGSGAIGSIIALSELGLDGNYLGTLFMGAVSLPFWAAYAANRKENWWALIPGWATAVIAAIILLESVLPGEVIGAMVMFGIALPFFIVFLGNREHWWALIPAGVLSVIGVVVLISAFASGEFIGALVMFGIALPFAFLFLRNREHWWALIPAGVMGTIGVIVLLAGLSLPGALEGRLIGGALFLGWALTFAVLWWMYPSQPTAWAKYPAVGLGAIALLIAIFGDVMDVIWPLAIIGVGIWLIYDNRKQPKLKGE